MIEHTTAADVDAALTFIPQFDRARVVCLGDVMLDRFVAGSVTRVSPEAPIPVLSVSREEAMLGGVGNVGRNVASLGGAADLIGVVGADRAAHEVDELIAAQGGLTSRLIAQPDRPTTIKTRFVAQGQQLLRSDHETTAALSEESQRWVLAAVDDALDGATAVVLSDYAKGVLTDAVLSGALARAAQHGLPVVADPKGDDFTRYAGATVLTPNVRELGLATRLPVHDDDAVIAAAQYVRETCRVGWVLVTRSEKGMTLVGDGAPLHIPSKAREVYDVSGAGDTAVAALAVALAAGADMATAAVLANAAAGVVVGKSGTACVHPGDLDRALTSARADAGAGKIVDKDAALDRVALWRQQGLKVGFTNGCFDLIHPGHVSLMRQAKAACDRLVVALNSDASVARLKGPTRPVQPEAARATVLASFEMADLIVVFAEDTPLELITAIAPDVLIKGADYARADVIGGDAVEAAGGRVVLAELVDGESTTGTIRRLAQG